MVWQEAADFRVNHMCPKYGPTLLAQNRISRRIDEGAIVQTQDICFLHACTAKYPVVERTPVSFVRS